MKIFICDSETTDASRDAKVCEIGFIECGVIQHETHAVLQPLREYETLIHPHRPIDARAREIHGIDDYMVKGAPNLREVLPAAFGVAPTEHCYVIGHNFCTFDMKYLDGVMPRGADIGCSLRAARKFIPDMPTYSLAPLVEALYGVCGVDLPPMKRAHTSIGDCHRVLVVLNYILSFGTDIEHMLGTATERLKTISFGQYKGKPLEHLPEDYVEWLLSGECQSASWELKRALREL